MLCRSAVTKTTLHAFAGWSFRPPADLLTHLKRHFHMPRALSTTTPTVTLCVSVCVCLCVYVGTAGADPITI
ncbi:hypothetical protein AALO_G00042850 [Alosa alosa]|uniref:Uncharacterized protein n=1 Tax=Alosa alosa TaxID=278164 RepID=A0AAV6HAD7_9TELE|nr:hypothetical protein AALO_G00042850 [Alosa alosa]